MMTAMATAVLAAIPGERPESKLAALAVRLGAVYTGSCWRMSPAVRETLRGAAAALALEPPEPHDESSDLGWADLVLAAEARRQAQTAERVTTRFSRMCRGAGRQALFDGQGAIVAQLVAADLPVTPEVHRRAAVKRTLVDLWRARLQDRWPADCPDGRWERLAWLAYVGYALPPVFADQRRWEARSALATGLQGTGIEVGQVRASLEVARKLVLGEACERLGQAFRVS